MGRPAKNEIQVFNGIRYYKKPSGYFVCDPKRKGHERYLHRAMWITYRGPIPEGMEVHHKNHEKGDNRIANLELLNKSEHTSYHGKRRAETEPNFRRFIDFARLSAASWHGSEEGIAWHSEHGKRTWQGRRSEEHRCAHCGKSYSVFVGTRKVGFCSPACQSAARRRSGKDNEKRTCVICKGSFVVNKYAKTKTCSKVCWRTEMSRSKLRKGA